MEERNVMSKNGDSGGGDVAPPPNTGRAMELLRQVRAIQQQRSSGAAEKEDTFTEANRITTEIPESVEFHSQEDLHENDPGSQTGLMFPETLARFKIEKLVGEGGFARVFLAHDPKLDRKVALKVPKLGAIADLGSRERFDREARSAGILSHPSIVPVFESGNVGPLSYIAYEYCDGETLAEWIDTHSENLPFAESAKIVERLAYAVEHAHQRSIIHRDLKPANILVAESDGQRVENLRITDFGLAKNFQQTDAYKTAEGAIVGTPAYMSPEQALGQSDIGKPSDIYSLGVILYELLTGRLPFESKNRINTLHAVANEVPTPPSRIRKQIPADLESVCLKCIEKEPLKRYQSAFELASDLRNWSQGFGVTARRPSSLERMKTWCKRNPGITTALVGVTVGLAIALFQWNLAEQQKEIAVQAERRAQRNIKLSRDTIKSMVTDICTSSSIEQKFGLKLLVKAINLQKQLLDETSSDPQILLDTAKLYLQYSGELLNAMELEQAITALDNGLQLIATLETEDQNVIQPRDRLSTFICVRKAVVLSKLGRHDDAREWMQLAGSETASQSLSSQACLVNQEAVALVELDQLEEAWLKIQESNILFRSVEPKNDFQKLMRDGGLAGNHFWQGKIENKLKRYRQAEQTLMEGQRLLNPVMAATSTHQSMLSESTRMQRELGRAQLELGKYAESRKNMREAAASNDSLSEDFPQTPRYRFFACNMRLSLIRLELETKKWLAARKLALRLNIDFWQISFDKLNESGLHEAKELIWANLKLAEEFDTLGRDEFATEHQGHAASWIEFVKKENPDDSEIESFESGLAALTEKD